MPGGRVIVKPTVCDDVADVSPDSLAVRGGRRPSKDAIAASEALWPHARRRDMCRVANTIGIPHLAPEI